MRGLIAFLLSMAVAYATPALAADKIRVAQSSTATNCLMLCNAQAANCQTACLVPSIQTSPLPSGGVNANNAIPQTNPTANTICLSGCTTTRLSCQTNCARLSPSQ